MLAVNATSKSLEILLQYDVIFSDVYGVLHNSREVLPNVVNTYSALIAAGKKIVLISNAPRPSKVTLSKVHELGLTQLTHIATSGDHFIAEYQKKSLDIFKQPGFIHGFEVNGDLTNDIDFNRTMNIDEAGFILLLSYTFNAENIMQDEQLFKKAIELGIPAICPNPDKIVDAAGTASYPSGAYAQFYRQLGGEVYYYGKPYKEIYEFAKNKFSINESAKAIMIGDSMETDVQGANNIGIDSLLLLTGVTKNIDIHNYNFKPTYVLNNL